LQHSRVDAKPETEEEREERAKKKKQENRERKKRWREQNKVRSNPPYPLPPTHKNKKKLG
jgi:hypothetical protein